MCARVCERLISAASLCQCGCSVTEARGGPTVRESQKWEESHLLLEKMEAKCDLSSCSKEPFSTRDLLDLEMSDRAKSRTVVRIYKKEVEGGIFLWLGRYVLQRSDHNGGKRDNNSLKKREGLGTIRGL